MSTPHIRPVAICLFRHRGRILVSQDFDSKKGDYFCRPLGGGIEFGESSREAIVREVCEEIGAEIENLQLVQVVENFFTCEGQQGHEIVFVFDATFVDKALYRQEKLQAYEQGIDAAFTAYWRSPAEIRAEGARLVPEALEALLSEIK